MHKLRVADVNIKIDYKHPTLLKQAAAYEHDFEKSNFTISISDEDFQQLREENPHLNDDELEYIFTGSLFYETFLHFKGFMLHSSGVCVDGYAYLFSADPGTGKSTHTDLWLKYIPGAEIINDDKPAIRLIDDNIYVYGTPWSGKTDQNKNMRMPIGAIVFIERSEDNWIKEITPKEAIPLILGQTIRPTNPQLMNKLLDTLDTVLTHVKVYRFGCNISEDAVKTSYNAIKKENKQNEN